MGNHTHSDDYRMFARPQAGQDKDSAQIVGARENDPARKDGSGQVDGFTWVEDGGDSAGADGARGTSAPRSLSATDGSRSRWFNPYLCAAWAVVAIMLATGLAWLTGVLEPPSYVSVDPSTGAGTEDGPGIIASNLYSMGPFVLLFGLLGALTLFTVQAAAFRRAPGR